MGTYFIRLILVVALLGSALAFGTTRVEGHWQDWPTACDASSGEKAAGKLFQDANWTGDKEVECGNLFQSGDADWKDNDFKYNSGVGEVEWQNDQVTSLILFNRSPNYGICYVFYESAAFAGIYPRWSYWLDAKPSGSKYRWKAWTFTHPGWQLEPALNLNDSFSSARAYKQGENGIDNANDCKSQERQHYIETSSTFYQGVVY